MSNRISQGSPFQPTMLKETQGPTAPSVATRPPPQPEVKPAPQPPTDGFDLGAVRDFTRVLGQAVSAVASAIQAGGPGPIIRGDEDGKASDVHINGDVEPRQPNVT